MRLLNIIYEFKMLYRYINRAKGFLNYKCSERYIANNKAG